MNFALLRACCERGARWEKVALAAWIVILAFVCIRAFVTPTAKTVYPIFSTSARHWWNGLDLYPPHRPDDGLDNYRYSPTATALLTPFALLPDNLGGALWRLINMAALFAALGSLARSVLGCDTKQYAWLLLLIVPLSLQSVNNGQVNPLVLAAMLAAVAAVHEERWTLASVLLTLAFVIKIYPLALGLLLALLYPRTLGWRLPIALAGGLVGAFVFQQPAYVADQYEKWFALLAAEDRSAIPLEHMYRDLWLLIHLYGIPIDRAMYALLQVAAGAGVALVCWQRQRAGWPTCELLIATLALTTTWMMLLGPATESSSFMLLAPSLGWSVINAPRETWRRALLWTSGVAFALTVVLGGFSSTVRVHGFGIHPWATLLYLGYLLTETKSAIVLSVGHAARVPDRLAA